MNPLLTLSRLKDGIRRYFLNNAKFGIDQVTNSSYLESEIFSGKLRYSKRKKDLILLLLLAYYLKEANEPFAYWLYINLCNENSIKLFLGDFYSNTLDDIISILFVTEESCFSSIQKFHSYYTDKKLLTVLDQIFFILDKPKKPRETRRIGVGYRDKGSTRKKHEKIYLPSDVGFQYYKIQKRRVLLQLQHQLKIIAVQKRMEALKQSNYDFFVKLKWSKD